MPPGPLSYVGQAFEPDSVCRRSRSGRIGGRLESLICFPDRPMPPRLMSGNWWRREEWRGLTARDARPPGTASPSATLGSRRPGVVPSIDCHSSHTLPHSEAGNLWSPVAIYGDRLPSLRASASRDEHADPSSNPSRNDWAPMRDLARFRVRIANPASRAAASISPAEAGPEPRISRDHPWAWRRCGASRSGWQAAWSGVAVRSGPGLQPVTLGPDAAGRPGHHHMPDMSLDDLINITVGAGRAV